MSNELNWQQHCKTWPHSEQSQFIQAEFQRWHVQRWNDPIKTDRFLLIHGTGASSHSWAGIAPLLAQRAQVITLDLPGHGFSSPAKPEHCSLPEMARSIKQLLTQMDWQPTHIVGHSAGAAIAVQMALDQLTLPSTRIISINGALLPFGAYGMAFMAPLSKAIAQSTLIPRLFSWQAKSPGMLDFLLGKTGSNPPEQSKQCYRILIANASHAQGALTMMAAWNLTQLAKRLPALITPLHLLACANDLTISPQIANQVNRLIPQAQVHFLPNLGHLGHEESPAVFMPFLS
jgi:magnesium chelatase accessory protein